jgi:hypothetical protein
MHNYNRLEVTFSGRCRLTDDNVCTLLLAGSCTTLTEISLASGFNGNGVTTSSQIATNIGLLRLIISNNSAPRISLYETIELTNLLRTVIINRERNRRVSSSGI